MNTTQFSQFQTLVYQLTGVSIADSRKSMLASRVSSRMRACGEQDFDAYRELVLRCDEERDLFVDKVTTHETRFFRTPAVWEYIETVLFPEYLTSGKPLSAWSAACSSGEEAYSLAMLASQCSKQHSGFKCAIEASDISTEAVKRSTSSHYAGRNIDRFQEARPELFAEFMSTDGDGYSLSPKVAEQVKFYSHNLLDAPPKLARHGLVLLRNVLIYFSKEDQAKIIRNVRKAMTADGVLIIGESETIPYEDFGLVRAAPFIYRADA